MIKAILFDFDNTILDNEAAVERAFTHCLAKFKFTPETNLDKISGKTVEGAVNALFPSRSQEERTEFAEYFKAKYYGFYAAVLAKPFEDAKFLSLLKKKFKLALVTNQEKAYLEHALKQHSLEHFDLVITRDDVAHEKPAPEGLKLALQKLGLTPEEVVFVGDSKIDVETAKNAGVKCFLVKRKSSVGVRARKISSFQELLNLN